MSWWETGRQHFLIGDLPADRIGDALARVAADRVEAGAPAPSLVALLAALREALRRRDAGLRDLRAVTGQGEVAAAAVADPAVAEALAGAVEAVARTYVEAVGRAPSSGEVLANLAFVLRPEPGRYLSDAADLELREIVADTDEAGSKP